MSMAVIKNSRTFYGDIVVQLGLAYMEIIIQFSTVRYARKTLGRGHRQSMLE